MKVGAQIVVIKDGEERKAEVLALKDDLVYVHYVGFNKRLDEWIQKDLISVKDVALLKDPTTEPSFDRVQEIEKLRVAGSMTLNPAEIARVKNISKICFGWSIIHSTGHYSLSRKSHY